MTNDQWSYMLKEGEVYGGGLLGVHGSFPPCAAAPRRKQIVATPAPVQRCGWHRADLGLQSSAPDHQHQHQQIAMADTALKFGPEWLRALTEPQGGSDGGGEARKHAPH